VNEKLKGWRTQIAMVLGVVLSTMDTLREFVMAAGGLIDAQMADGGAAAAIVALIVGGKALVTDVIPKIKGNLDRTTNV